MKKFLIIPLILILTLTLTGCGKKQEAKPVVVKKTPNVKKEELSITYSARTKANEVVYYLKNKGERDAHDINVEVEFWKKAEEVAPEENPEEAPATEDDGFEEEGKKKDDDKKNKDTYVGSTKTSFEFIKKDYAVAGVASVGSREYDYYKIFVDIDKENDITQRKEFAYNDLIVEDKTKLTVTDEEKAKGITPDEYIMLTVKNKGKTRINFIELGVVFYKDNEIVGYSKKQKQNLDSKIKSTLKVSFPIGKSYSDKVPFDTYRVFVNKSYRDKYQ